MKCGGTFQIKDLCKDSRDRRGYRRRCHPCQAALTRASNNGKQRPTNSTNRMKRDLIRAAKDNPCKDCKKSFPYYVMDLDHLPEFEKKFQLGKYMHHTVSEVIEELSKCEVVCGNCHRYRTHNRGYYIRSGGD